MDGRAKLFFDMMKMNTGHGACLNMLKLQIQNEMSAPFSRSIKRTTKHAMGLLLLGFSLSLPRSWPSLDLDWLQLKQAGLMFRARLAQLLWLRLCMRSPSLDLDWLQLKQAGLMFRARLAQLLWLRLCMRSHCAILYFTVPYAK
jgi:hypothetical protein